MRELSHCFIFSRETAHIVPEGFTSQLARAIHSNLLMISDLGLFLRAAARIFVFIFSSFNFLFVVVVRFDMVC